MSGVSNHCLVQIANLDRHLAFAARQRSKIADVAVTANPDLGSVRHIGWAGFEPVIKLKGTAANIRMSRARHLQASGVDQGCLPIDRQADGGIMNVGHGSLER